MSTVVVSGVLYSPLDIAIQSLAGKASVFFFAVAPVQALGKLILHQSD